MMLGMDGKRYKLWWFGKTDAVGDVGIMVKVVEVRRASDIMMAVVLVFLNDVLSMICGYAPQSRIFWKKYILFMIAERCVGYA